MHQVFFKARSFATILHDSFGADIFPFSPLQGILVGGPFRESLALVVMGLPAVVAGLVALWLPETKGRRLPETVEDVEDIKG